MYDMWNNHKIVHSGFDLEVGGIPVWGWAGMSVTWLKENEWNEWVGERSNHKTGGWVWYTEPLCWGVTKRIVYENVWIHECFYRVATHRYECKFDVRVHASSCMTATPLCKMVANVVNICSEILPLQTTSDKSLCSTKKHYPPGNHHASHILKCPISRS